MRGPTARDRGVSTTVSYVLTLAITAILISGLLVAVTGVVDDRRDQTGRNALNVIGERIAANLMAADRLAETDPEATVVTVRLPERISERGYSVTIDGGAEEIVLTLGGSQTTVTVSFAAEPVVDATVRGGDLRIVLTPADELEVRSA
ncbi:MAG: hypothetical protein ABEJ43_01270 [Haloferacaceae archaeon]